MATKLKMDELPIPASETPIPGRTTKYYPLLAGLVLVVAVGAVGAAFYYNFKLNDLKLHPQTAALEETKTLVNKISQLIVLPADEEPTIATVVDPAKLKDQPFFAKAKAGDKVLIYSNANKAILYDPVANKLLEVAPLNIGETAGADTKVQSATTTKTSK